MDIRESFSDWDEHLRAIISGLLKDVWTAMPVQVTQDTTDGHVAVVQPTIQRQVLDPGTGAITYEDHTEHVDVPITHMGGGGVSITHPTKMGDTGKVIYASRPLDTWFQSDGSSNQPIDNRTHSLGDGMFISGVRSVVRMLQQVSQDASHTRSDDKLHVAELHPQNGHTIKSAAPGTAPASASFDPFTTAAAFALHTVMGAMGISGSTTAGGVTHAHGVTQAAGAFMSALNNLHQVLAHPTMGALLSAENGAHTVTASPTGVMIQSATAIAMSAPSLSLPSGGVSGSALASGAAASNVGPVGGDLSGTLPNPEVIGITHVTGANLLPNAANDSAAATAGVALGSLYRNGSVLMVRVA